MANLNSPPQPGFYLRDYHHAAKTFTQEPGYTKTPYAGFLFHVNISFNSILGRLNNIETKDISVLVKAADLPETKFETETLNQYNRKRIVNKRISYEPIKLEFHDDVANNVRNMWIAYNQHYNADSTYVLNSTWAIDDVYKNYALNRRYGLDTGNSLPFINKIEIYSMGNQEYSKLLLVNPVIISAAFDNHEYSQATKTMAMTITVEYENIIYSAGTTNQISNFGNSNPENYDQNYSTLNSINLNNNNTLGGIVTETSSRPDTPIISTGLASPTISVNQLDSNSGNVTRTNSNRSTPLSNTQYQDIKEATVSSVTANRTATYVFPDTVNVVTNNAIEITNRRALIKQTLSQQPEIISSNLVTNNRNISSNGNDVSTAVVVNNNNTNISLNLRSSPYQTSVSTDIPELFISPVIPNNLTPAERELFVRSYPPLPSTDNRVSAPPYV